MCATCWWRSLPLSTISAISAGAPYTQQMHGEPVRFAEKRSVELGEERVRAVAGGIDGQTRVFIYADDEPDRRVTLQSSWWFGMPRVRGDDRRQAHRRAGPPKLRERLSPHL